MRSSDCKLADFVGAVSLCGVRRANGKLHYELAYLMLMGLFLNQALELHSFIYGS